MRADSYNNPSTAGGNREDLRGDVTLLEPQATPFCSMAKKGTASAVKTEWMTDTLRKVKITGSPEGRDAQGTGNKAKDRKRLETFQHRVFEEYSVSDVQEAISKRKGNAATASELDYSRIKALKEVKRDMEAICLADQDHQGESANDMRTRGLFDWIDASGPADVPASVRPSASQIKTGVSADLSEGDVNDLMQALFDVYGEKMTLQAFLNSNLVKNFDGFGNTDLGATRQRYSVVQDASKHEIDIEVKFYSSSFGRLAVVPSHFCKVNATTGVPDANAGLFVNMELCELRFLEDLFSEDTPDHGGGGGGYIRGMFANVCKNPKGFAKITS